MRDLKLKKSLLFYFSFYEQGKFYAQLSWAWKKFYNLGACWLDNCVDHDQITSTPPADLVLHYFHRAEFWVPQDKDDYRCASDCRSRGHKFNPGLVPCLSGDWSWNNFYSHSPPFRWYIQEGSLSVISESMCTNFCLTACSSLLRKKCG